MANVICNKAFTMEICNGCGASKPHDESSCEPCPVNFSAKCKPAKPEILVECIECGYNADQTNFFPPNWMTPIGPKCNSIHLNFN